MTRRRERALGHSAAGVAALLAAFALAGCAGGTRTIPGGPVLPGGPLARAAMMHSPSLPDSLGGQFAVYRGDGRPAAPEELAAALADVDVAFLGELHDDAIGHAIQQWFFATAAAGGRPVALGLEMFERDVQLVLDEYLAGSIRERDFLAAARPWSDYARFYRPLVEHARENGLPVLATNAPARYVSLVSRRGTPALGDVRAGHVFLPPLPVAPASPALAAKFEGMMAGMPAHGAGTDAPTPANLLAAQNLRDASMAFAVAGWLEDHPGALVVHVNGSFHSEGGLGVPEHLAAYAPRARALIVTFRVADDPSVAPAASAGDDFVIVTRRTTGE